MHAYMFASFFEVDLQSNDLESTDIYGWSMDIWIDWLTCGKLIFTMLIHLPYDVFNIFPLFPPSFREIRFGGFGLLDTFIIGYFHWYST